MGWEAGLDPVIAGLDRLIAVIAVIARDRLTGPWG
jgi:hypothetical protein